jgi:hypothetical protein
MWVKLRRTQFEQMSSGLAPTMDIARCNRHVSNVAEGAQADHVARRRALHHEAAQGRDDADEWRAAMQALLLVAERNGPTMLARIGMSALQSQSNLKQLSRSFCAMATFVRVTREPSGDFIFVNMVAFRCLASGCRRLRLWPDGG